MGELSNFLLGAVFAFIAGLIYKRHKSRAGALWGSLAGAATMALISLPINYFIVYPAYVVLYGLPLEGIVGCTRPSWARWPTCRRRTRC